MKKLHQKRLPDKVNNMKSQYPLPDHYHILAEELGPLTVMLREVLQYYPSPEGKPLEDISGLIDEMNHVLKQNIEGLVTATHNLTAEVLAKEYVPRETIRQAVAQIEEPLLNMIGCYHDFWKRPFPAGLEEGQMLFTDILKKPVEEYLGQLEMILFTINNPGEASDKYGIDRIELRTVFHIEDAVNAFHRWLKKTHRSGKKTVRKGLWILLFALSAGFTVAFLSTIKPGKTDNS
ncbi:MAG: hypothetical protein A4E64_01170 [Syntrophorhabdus sp. PtaU1.Bin058]|nr:MAG: hypothetical protein A4E64_01170 [Syntrophorhabdus sp. PtaU1.Bin058]